MAWYMFPLPKCIFTTFPFSWDKYNYTHRKLMWTVKMKVWKMMFLFKEVMFPCQFLGKQINMYSIYIKKYRFTSPSNLSPTIETFTNKNLTSLTKNFIPTKKRFLHTCPPQKKKEKNNNKHPAVWQFFCFSHFFWHSWTVDRPGRR